ncbi:MAG: hypothetical protein K5924_10110 [Chloroflexi bacterium]|nr:hypothetical protein [Chloroflexota bacterium]
MTEDASRSIAEELRRRGLAAPARLLLDAHRPLAPLLADVGAALSPLLSRGFGPRMGGLSMLIEDEKAMDRVIVELDRLGTPTVPGDGDAEPG